MVAAAEKVEKAKVKESGMETLLVAAAVVAAEGGWV